MVWVIISADIILMIMVLIRKKILKEDGTTRL